MEPDKRYVYQPLESTSDIRLLVLEIAEEFSAPLRCSVIHEPRDQTPEYDAISYTWGEPNFTHTLQIHDPCGAPSHLQITANVDSALRHLRRLGDQIIPLWIDAICLNQQDDEEKAQQIPFMSRIYGQARIVRIWLGDEDMDTSKLFQELQETTGEQLEQSLESAQSSDQLRDSFDRIFRWRPFKRRFGLFSRRTWFSRRWTIQEACLARNARVHCGSLDMPLWRLVTTAEHFLRLNYSIEYSSVSTTYPIEMMSYLGQSTPNLSMLNLLERFHRAECLEPRDRVAGLYGLLNSKNRIPLDFDVHWTQLYRDLAIHVLTGADNSEKLDLLLHLFEFGPVTDGLELSIGGAAIFPSWVPNWSSCREWKLPLRSTARKAEWAEIVAKPPQIKTPPFLTFCHDEAAAQISWDIPNSDFDENQRSPLECCQQVTQTWQLDDEWKQDLDPNFKSSRSSTRQEAQVSSFTSILDEAFTRGGTEWQHNFVAVCFLIHTFIVVLNLVDFRYGDGRVRSHLENKFRGIENLMEFETLQFRVLSKLPNLMLRFSFFTVAQGRDEKSAPRHGSGVTSACYGFSSNEVVVGDILVPLWDVHLLPWKYAQGYVVDSMGTERAALAAMLVIRPEDSGNKTSSPVRDTGHGDRGKTEKQKLHIPRGRIIGPAVCVYFKEGESSTEEAGCRASRFQTCTLLLD